MVYRYRDIQTLTMSDNHTAGLRHLHFSGLEIQQALRRRTQRCPDGLSVSTFDKTSRHRAGGKAVCVSNSRDDTSSMRTHTIRYDTACGADCVATPSRFREQRAGPALAVAPGPSRVLLSRVLLLARSRDNAPPVPPRRAHEPHGTLPRENSGVDPVAHRMLRFHAQDPS